MHRYTHRQNIYTHKVKISHSKKWEQMHVCVHRQFSVLAIPSIEFIVMLVTCSRQPCVFTPFSVGHHPCWVMTVSCFRICPIRMHLYRVHTFVCDFLEALPLAAVYIKTVFHRWSCADKRVTIYIFMDLTFKEIQKCYYVTCCSPL